MLDKSLSASSSNMGREVSSPESFILTRQFIACILLPTTETAISDTNTETNTTDDTGIYTCLTYKFSHSFVVASLNYYCVRYYFVVEPFLIKGTGFL